MATMTPVDIKNLRERLGLKQADFAKLLGVAQATVSKWETGNIVVSGLARMAFEQVPTTRRKALKRLRQLEQLKQLEQQEAEAA